MHLPKKDTKKLNNLELLHFFEPLGMILHSGISAMEGLQILKDDSTDEETRELFSGLLSEMELTGRLSESLRSSGRFPEAAISYIEVGEETGCLDEVLHSLAERYEQELNVSAQIRSAVTYPLFMLGMMGFVILLLLVKVLPVFQQVFRQMGMEMNGLSGGLLRIGTLFSRYAVIFLVLLAVVIALLLYTALTEKGRARFFQLLFRVPALKGIPLTLDYSHLAQGMELGLRSGLGPESSVRMARMLVSTPEVIASLDKAVRLLEEGGMFTEAMTESGLFSGMDARMIQIGFRTGTMDDVMHRFSRHYQDESLSLIGRTVSVIEPTIVVVMSLLVGMVLLSVMIPLLGIMSGVMM